MSVSPNDEAADQGESGPIEQPGAGLPATLESSPALPEVAPSTLPAPRAGFALDPNTIVAAQRHTPAAVSALDPKNLWNSFRRRWVLALSIGVLLGSVVGCAVYILLPPRYTVYALLHVAQNEPSILNHAQISSPFISYQKTQLVMVKTELVLNSALHNNPRVAELRLIRQEPDPLHWLEKEVSADFIAPEVMRIYMTGQDTAEMSILVNAVRDAYMKEIVNKERNDKLQHYDDLNRIAAQTDATLKAKKQHRRDVAINAGSRNSETLQKRQQFAAERLAYMQRELWNVQSQRRMVEIDVFSDDKDLNAAPGDDVVNDLIDRDKVIQKMRENIEMLEQKVEDTLRVVAQGEGDPTIKGFRNRIADLNKEIDARRKQLKPILEKELRAHKRGELSAAAVNRQRRIRYMVEWEKRLKDELKDMELKNAAMSRDTLDVEDANDDVVDKEQISKEIHSRIALLEIELNAPARVQTLQNAVSSSVLNSSRQISFAGGAGGGVFALAVLGICWWDSRLRRVSGPADVQSALNVHVMGTLPTLNRRGQAGRYGQNLMVESVDAMRTSLMHFARVESLRSVMVTSALPGEGKTSLAGHLAASLARAGCRTLLVDADLRNPAAHRLFDIPLGQGLSELLRGEVTVEEVTVPTRVAGLSMICAGKKDRVAIDALSHSGGEIFRQLEQNYDLVVVDSSPVLPVADALLVGQQVDAVIFSVLCDVSRMPALLAAHERMTMLGFRILGAVVNGVRQETYGSAY